MRNMILTIALLATAAIATPAIAEEFQVKMLNKGENGAMVFEPDFVKAMPGDTIRFVPTDKGHNIETVKGMLPDGAEAVKTKFNVEYVMSAEAEGVYGIKCSPHYGMGMVALISVGEPINLEEAKAVKLKGKAKARFEAAFEKLENALASAPTTN